MVTRGACGDLGLHPIGGKLACEEAARVLELAQVSAQLSGVENRPEGCYLYNRTQLWLAINPRNQGNGAQVAGNMTRYPICSVNPEGVRIAISRGSRGASGAGATVVAAVAAVAAVLALRAEAAGDWTRR